MSHRKTLAIALVAILSAATLVAFVPAGQASFHGNLGSFVSNVNDKDFVPVLEDAPGTTAFCFGYIEDSSNPADPAKYAWLMHVAADGVCTAGTTSPAAQRSWLITGFGGTAQQKWLSTADTQYTGRTFDGIQELDDPATDTWMCYSEADGIDGYSIGDIIYIKGGFSTGASQSMAVDDLRISAVSSTTLTPFSIGVGILKSTDTDFTRGGQSTGSPPTVDPTQLPVSRTLVCGGFEVKMLNLGSLTIANSQDVFYVIHSDLLTEDTVYPGMLRITSTTGVTGHGQKVLAANTDSKRTLQILGAAAVDLVVVDDLGSGDIFDKKLAIQQATHPAGADTVVRMNDIFIKRGTGHTASSPGTLVTAAPSSNQIGVGSTLATQTPLAAQIYYIDTAPIGTFDSSDPVYIKHDDNSGTGVEVGDIRVSVPSQTSGSSVRNSDSDYLQHQSATAVHAFSLKLYSERDDTRMPLKAISAGKFVSATGVAIWDPTTDPVFITTASSVTDGLTAQRIWNAGAPDDTDVTFDCSGAGGTGPDTHCGESLRAGKVKTTGQSTDWTGVGEGQGDRLFWSDDNFLTVGDYRMATGNHVEVGGQVATGDSDVTPGALFQSSGVTLFASVHTGFEHPTAEDIQLYPGFGTRWTASTSGSVPRTQTTTFELVRADFGDSGSLNGDGYYLDFSPSSFTPGRVLRMTPAEGKAAGTFLQSGDTIEIQSTKDRTGHADDADHFGYIDNSPSGLDPNDFVYLNLPADAGGSAADTLTQWDSRVTPVSHGTNFAAGTQVKAGDADFQSFSGNTLEGAGDGTGSGDGAVLWYDVNSNGVVDDDDALWLRLRTGLATNVPAFLDIRLNGPAGSTGGGGGGGGGGSTPPPAVPSLSNGRATPAFIEAGSAQSFEVTYTHGGNTAPSTRNVILDGETFTLSTTDTTYSDGSLYRMTKTMNAPGEFEFHFEFTAGGTTVRLPSSGSYTAYVGPEENVAPTLTEATVSPSEGGVGEEFAFRVTYKDANNDAPVDPKVHIDLGDTTEEVDLNCQGTAYYAGVSCVATSTLSASGTLGYHFSVGDGQATARSPASGTHSGPTVGDGTDPGTSPSPSPDATGSPSPTPTEDEGSPGPAVVLVLVALGALLVALRRRER